MKMIYRHITCLLIIIFMASFTTGCLRIHSHVREIKPYARPMKAVKYEVIGPVEKIDSSFKLLWFIPVTPYADENVAIEEAIYSMGGDNLIDVRVWQEKQVWIVGLVKVIRVSGKAIRYKE